MRSEHRPKCPKCGHRWIDISEGYLFDKDRLEAEEIVDKFRSEGKYCEFHQLGYTSNECPMCTEEIIMNKFDVTHPFLVDKRDKK